MIYLTRWIFLVFAYVLVCGAAAIALFVAVSIAAIVILINLTVIAASNVAVYIHNRKAPHATEKPH